MSKLNINFNDNNYSIDESALAPASATLESHLSTVINGTGAKINFSGNSYDIDSAKLSTATNSFVSHLGTIAGGNAGGGDTLTWDGNTEGLVSVSDMFYKVSDIVLTDEQIKLGFMAMSTGQTTPAFGTGWDSGVAAGYITEDVVVMEVIGFVRKPNVSIMGITFPETGIYFMSCPTDDGVAYVKSLTIPNYTGFGGGSGSKVTVNGVEYSIDPTKVAGAIAELEAVLAGLNSPAGSDTLTWDGNTEGLLNLGNVMFKVSDAVPTVEDFVNGYEATSYNANGEEKTTSATYANMESQGFFHQQEGFIVLGDFGIVVLKDNLEVGGGMTYPEAGVWLINNGSMYATSLTIPGYTGF